MMSSSKDEDFDEIMNNNFNTNSGYDDSNSMMSGSSQHPFRMQNSQTSAMSKAELRKNNKPIMEKKRRARINHCLNELKSLILEAMKKDPARHTKLEKADILEMTVKHLQSIQRQQLSLAVQTDPTVIHKFKTGFAECAEEVSRYVSQLDCLEPGVRSRLSNHLHSCINGLEQIGTFSNFSSNFRPTSTASTCFNSQFPTPPSSSQLFPLSSQDPNNNGRIQMGNVQLIPSRLPTGELALVMPNSSNMPFFPPNIPHAPSLDFSTSFSRLSAFTKPANHQPTNSRAHTTQQAGPTTSSPPLSPISSVSSCGDDSMTMHTSADFQNKTPPLNLNISGIYPTPPSGESLKLGGSHLQQSLVSSTSEFQNFTKVLTAATNFETPKTSLKRKSSTVSNNEHNDGEQPTKKSLKTEDEENGNVKASNNPEASNESMWRPW